MERRIKSVFTDLMLQELERDGLFSQELGYRWTLGNGEVKAFTLWKWRSESWSWVTSNNEISSHSLGLGFVGRASRSRMDYGPAP